MHAIDLLRSGIAARSDSCFLRNAMRSQLVIAGVFKTTVTYFIEDLAKVTFIVDTTLVVMLTEVIS
jgi:hypothetical protein